MGPNGSRNLALAAASMMALSMSDCSASQMGGPIGAFGMQQPRNWHGFAGLGRGKATPSKRRRHNAKHAHCRARRARAVKVRGL